jgi:hypothetical protein
MTCSALHREISTLPSWPVDGYVILWTEMRLAFDSSHIQKTNVHEPAPGSHSKAGTGIKGLTLHRYWQVSFSCSACESTGVSTNTLRCRKTLESHQPYGAGMRIRGRRPCVVNYFGPCSILVSCADSSSGTTAGARGKNSRHYVPPTAKSLIAGFCGGRQTTALESLKGVRLECGAHHPERE